MKPPVHPRGAQPGGTPTPTIPYAAYQSFPNFSQPAQKHEATHKTTEGTPSQASISGPRRPHAKPVPTLASKHPFFCCDDYDSYALKVPKHSIVYDLVAFQEYMRWVKHDWKPTTSINSPLTRPVEWAPFILRLESAERPGVCGYYMPIPHARKSTDSSHTIHPLSAKLDFIRIHKSLVDDAFLGAVATTRIEIICDNHACARSQAIQKRSRFIMRLLPAQYSYDESAIPVTAQRHRLQKLRKAIGHLQPTQDLLLALDTHNGNVEAAEEYIARLNDRANPEDYRLPTAKLLK